jgi:5'-nucleotidase
MVVSGINQGANLGDDVLISGTVAGALQGYLRGLHAMAVSTEAVDSHHLDIAAKSAAILAEWIYSTAPSDNIFLNVNLPDQPLARIKGVKVARLASGTHTDAAEERNDGKGTYYWLVRHKLEDNTVDSQTDVWAIEQGNISITPLHIELLNKSTPTIPDHLGSALLQELQRQQRDLPNQ